MPQNDTYLESKVLTAQPQQLQLMLVEGAIRFGRQAAQSYSEGDVQAASEPLLRVIDIVGEMLAGVRKQESDLNRKIADLYWYLFRTVTEAKINDDAAKLDEALQLLDYEHETWLAVCDKIDRESTSTTGSSTPSSPPKQAPLPHAPLRGMHSPTHETGGGISFQA